MTRRRQPKGAPGGIGGQYAPDPTGVGSLPAISPHPRLDRLKTIPAGPLADVDQARVNPHPTDAPETGWDPWCMNCQRVVVAAELRARGYDVKAVGFGRHMVDSRLIDLCDMFHTRDGRRRRFTDPPKTAPQLERAMLRYPVGSRFFVFAKPKGRRRGGHVWNATVEPGPRITFHEFQDDVFPDGGCTDVYEKTYTRFKYLRIDDMEPDDRVLDGEYGDVPVVVPSDSDEWTPGRLDRVRQRIDIPAFNARYREYCARGID